MKDVARTVKRYLNENIDTFNVNEFNNKIKGILSQLNIPVNEKGKSFIVGNINKSIDNIEIEIGTALYDTGKFENRIIEINNEFKNYNIKIYDGHICFIINIDNLSINNKRNIGINVDNSDMELFLKDFKKYLRQNKFKPYYIEFYDDEMCEIGVALKKIDIINGLNNFLTLLEYYVQFLNNNFEEYFGILDNNNSKEFFIEQTNDALDEWSRYGEELIDELLDSNKLSLNMEFMDAWDIVEPYFLKFLNNKVGGDWNNIANELGFTNSELDGLYDALSTKTDVLLDYGFKDEY
jgi:hypothetical protein